MARPNTTDYAPYMEAYIQLTAGHTVQALIAAYAQPLVQFYTQLPESKANHAYDPGKWTVKEVLQHVIDTERIFAYRLLRISRGDTTPLPGFEENSYAAAALAGQRSLDALKAEWTAVRHSTDLLLQSLSEEQLQQKGRCNDNPVTANAIAFCVYGHQLHHRKILEERYW